MCGQAIVPAGRLHVDGFVQLLHDAHTLFADRFIIDEFNFGRIVAIFLAAFDNLETFASNCAQNRTTIAE